MTEQVMTKQIADRFKIRSVSAASARIQTDRATASLAVAQRRRDGTRMGVGPHAD